MNNPIESIEDENPFNDDYQSYGKTVDHFQVKRLARLARVPCPLILHDHPFEVAIWTEGKRFGHIYPREGRVTVFDGIRHVNIYTCHPYSTTHDPQDL